MPPKGRALTPEKLETIIDYISKFTSGEINLKTLIVDGKKNKYLNSRAVVKIFIKLFKEADYERLKTELTSNNIKRENYATEIQYWYVVLTRLRDLKPEVTLKKNNH